MFGSWWVRHDDQGAGTGGVRVAGVMRTPPHPGGSNAPNGEHRSMWGRSEKKRASRARPASAERESLVVVGGGMTAFHFIESLIARRADERFEITLVTEIAEIAKVVFGLGRRKR